MPRMREPNALGLDDVLSLTVVALLVWGLGHVYTMATESIAGIGWTISVVAVVTTSVPIVLRYLPVLRNPKTRELVLAIALRAATVITPLLAITIFFCVYHVFRHTVGFLPWAIAVMAVFTLIAVLVNINVTSPDRL